MRTRLRRRIGLATLVVALLAVSVPSASARGSGDGTPQRWYRASVVTTEYGIPHVHARDVGSLGFGNGWAAARDNLCVIAETAVTTDGQRVRWFGATQDNVVSDVIQGWLLADGRVERLLTNGPDDRPPGPSEDARTQVAGFAAGFNRYLADIGGPDGITDPRCAGAEWVRPLTVDDLWRRYYLAALRASTGALAAGIVAAEPPAGAAATAADATAAASVDTPMLDAMVDELGATDELGSNAYGLGSETTRSSHGMVLGNPHFPWDGEDRFWQVHLTIPGELDVQGASLIGTPGVQIGTTRSVAWSHTVSTATRFALRVLELVPGDPTSYVVDGEVHRMTPRTVDVPDGPSGTVWETMFGPVVVVPSLGIGWDESVAFALDDANEDNLRMIDQWNAMNRAQSVEELLAATQRWLGIPWVNTTAADRSGTALYTQTAVTTGVPDELAEQCVPAALQPVWQSEGIPVLAGTTRACDPIAAPDAPVDGILGPSQLPVLLTDEYVTQSNDSHWLSNPDQPLEGFARVVGDERTPRSLRTRMGLVQVEERLAGTDDLWRRGFTVPALRRVMFANRGLAAELVVDDLVALCREARSATAEDGRPVDLRWACRVLDRWDRRVDVDSRGAVLFREFGAAGGVRFAVPFDPDDPVATPNTLDTDDPAVLTALATAVARLRDAGIPLHVPLGAVQTEDRGGEAIAIHGGRSSLGVFNVINAPFQGPAGYPDVTSGASFLMAVELADRGPRGSMLMSYSQSSDPTSPHFADQTRLYSKERWVPLRWDRRDVRRHAIDRTFLVGRG